MVHTLFFKGKTVIIEVYNNVYIGTELDYQYTVKAKDDFMVISACENPSYQEMINNKKVLTANEKLFIYDKNRLVLNMFDSVREKDFAKEMINEAMVFFKKAVKTKNKLFVHCNYAKSRSPSLTMLGLAMFTDCFSSKDFDIVAMEFRDLYKDYYPSKGIYDFLKTNWKEYIKKTASF